MFLSEQIIIAIILVSLVGSYLMNNLADYLNLGNLNSPLPNAFCDVYDSDRYDKSQAYLKETTRFGMVSASVDLGLILIFWFCNGFGILDSLVRSLGQNPIVTGLLFIGILGGLKLLVSLPFSVYSTFIIEERYGFNKTTGKTFVLDLIKTILISTVLGSALLSLILWFFESAGSWAWMLCWIATSLFLLGVQYIVPTWIMPLFNRFTPLESGPLKKAIFTYARSIDFPLTQIFVMDGSKRSAKSNAFFTGFGKNKRIVLYDTLIKEQDEKELVGVLAHEMGHFKKKHIQRRMVLGIVQTGILFYLISLFISQESLFHAFFVDTPSVYAGLVFFSILFSPIDLIISIAMQISSRRDEYEADRFAADTTNHPQAMISALKKLSAHNLSNLTPHPFYVFLNYSHPPIIERISALEKS
ncbi:MAG: M48 family metallopeptidase [Desulfobacter sp.]|nr:M48 family metallopeptidase [Desulfobacter sp.]